MVLEKEKPNLNSPLVPKYLEIASGVLMRQSKEKFVEVVVSVLMDRNKMN